MTFKEWLAEHGVTDGEIKFKPNEFSIWSDVWDIAISSMQNNLDAKDKEIEKYKQGYERYEKARLMNVKQWQDAFLLNIQTGKPFDQIIDEFKI